MNFVASSVDPPPIASKKSTFSTLANSTACIQVSNLGFASMPENSVNL